MSGVKPWQIVLIVLALLALPASWLWVRSGAPEIDLAESVTLVEISTGDLFVAPLPKGRMVALPATNPETGKPTLYPVYQKDGKWFVSDRYLSMLGRMTDPAPKFVDPKTGEVTNAGKSPVNRDLL